MDYQYRASSQQKDKEILEEMDYFLKNHKLPALNQGAIDYLNSPITIKEIDSIIKKFPRNNSPGPKLFQWRILPDI